VDKEHSISSLLRRIRDLEQRDPLSDNETLVRAVEKALQLVAIRRYGGMRKKRGGLLRNPDYLRSFVRLALDPNVTREELGKRLGISQKTVGEHMQAFTGYLNDFVNDAPLLRSKEVGFGWRNDKDLEEQ